MYLYNIIKCFSKLTTKTNQIRPNIFILDFKIAQAFIITFENNWILVDTGLESSGKYIIKKANKLFNGKPPKCIILTHGHFDHIGSIKQLIEKWDVAVYAHCNEIPYLNGQKDYKKPDPSVGGGLVSKMSFSFPHEGINIKNNLLPLPDDFSIPYLKNWKWLHTPGHTEGHISLFDEEEKILIAGDAFTSLTQESLFSVITKKENINTPPKYFTTNWDDAFNSIKKIRELKPNLALLSHGKPIAGIELKKHLDYLINHFPKVYTTK